MLIVCVNNILFFFIVYPGQIGNRNTQRLASHRIIIFSFASFRTHILSKCKSARINAHNLNRSPIRDKSRRQLSDWRRSKIERTLYAGHIYRSYKCAHKWHKLHENYCLTSYARVTEIVSCLCLLFFLKIPCHKVNAWTHGCRKNRR